MAKASQPKGELTLRTIAMPADTNPADDIFGGWVLSQMDIAGGIAARTHTRIRVVTVSITSMTFITPVKVGDLLTIYTEIGRIGRTSVAIKMETWVRRGLNEETLRVTEGEFVYVAVDEDGRPTPILKP